MITTACLIIGMAFGDLGSFYLLLFPFTAGLDLLMMRLK